MMSFLESGLSAVLSAGFEVALVVGLADVFSAGLVGDLAVGLAVDLEGALAVGTASLPEALAGAFGVEAALGLVLAMFGVECEVEKKVVSVYVSECLYATITE